MEKADVRKNQLSYLYSTGDAYVFMDNNTYDQIEIPATLVENEAKFLKEGMNVESMVIEGEEAISTIRKLVGATNPLEADLGTIRGDFAMDTGRNIIHASDSPDSAEREINLFFNEDEICDYEIVDNKLIYE